MDFAHLSRNNKIDLSYYRLHLWGCTAEMSDCEDTDNNYYSEGENYSFSPDASDEEYDKDIYYDNNDDEEEAGEPEENSFNINNYDLTTSTEDTRHQPDSNRRENDKQATDNNNNNAGNNQELPCKPYIDTDGCLVVATKGYIHRLGRWTSQCCDGLIPSRRHVHIPWPGRKQGKYYICWYDGHPFNNLPFGYCKKYDEKRKKWFMHEATFCSAECTLAFAHSTESQTLFFQERLQDTWAFFHEHMGIKWRERIYPAPSRFILKQIQPETGISIDEFRKNFRKTRTTVLPDNVLSIVTRVEEIQFAKKETRARMKRRIDKQQQQSRNKRHQPQTSRMRTTNSGSTRRLSVRKEAQPSGRTPLLEMLSKKTIKK